MEVIVIACYYPLIAVRDGDFGDVSIQGSFRDLYEGSTFFELDALKKQEITDYAKWCYMKKTGQRYLMNPKLKTLEIPCGRCIGCRLEYSRQWANRNVIESLYHDDDRCWFLTLTIDEDWISREYLTESGFATVHNDDISSFMKAVRGHWSEKYGVKAGIRFYASSEYGGESLRPHYHILVYGLPIYDLKFFKRTPAGDVLWNSPELMEIWKRGWLTVSEFNWNTAAYTARYVMKKAQGLTNQVYDAFGVEPEKTRMSRRPGIGMALMDKAAEFYALDEIVLPPSHGKLNVIKPPKAFDKKLRAMLKRGEDFVTVTGRKFSEILKDRERTSKLLEQAATQAHGYDPVEYLAAQEYVKDNSLKLLKRS